MWPAKIVRIARCTKWVLLFFCFSMEFSVAIAAVLVDNRSALQSLLGATAVTENFEKFRLGSAPQLTLPSDKLDSSTVLPGQGPGLVVEGVRFDGQGDVLSIENLGVPGSSQVLNGGLIGESTFLMDFFRPVRGVGFDFLPGALTGETIDFVVLAADDSTVLNTFTIPVFSSPTFVGAEDANGIGGVTITSHINPPFNAISIDNLTFGVVPEPSAMLALLIGAGCTLVAARKRLSRMRC